MKLSLVLAVVLLSAVTSGRTLAAEPVKIGALNEGWGPTPATAALREGLKALGYREGEQFVIGVRFTQGDSKALPAAARQLLQAGTDILFASGTNPARAAQAATTTVPIVFAEAISDPVQVGLVKSIARPGGNVTGVIDLQDELGPKRVELFKEIWPGLKRVAFVYDPNGADVSESTLQQLRTAARKVGVALVERPVRSEAEARRVLGGLRKGEDGLLAGGGSMSFNIPGIVLEATTQHRIPTMFNAAFFPERGAFASYGPDLAESGRQAARLVDKIIKGQHPSTIPVEANPHIEFVINLKVARALGISIAPAALHRATRVIE
jgi:putative ABC transport system substrate-binding protein